MKLLGVAAVGQSCQVLSKVIQDAPVVKVGEGDPGRRLVHLACEQVLNDRERETGVEGCSQSKEADGVPVNLAGFGHKRPVQTIASPGSQANGLRDQGSEATFWDRSDKLGILGDSKGIRHQIDVGSKLALLQECRCQRTPAQFAENGSHTLLGQLAPAGDVLVDDSIKWILRTDRL